MGRLGMSLADFRRLLPHQLAAILRHFRQGEQAQWERMRLLATLTLQPYSRGKLRPDKVLPFPWDKQKRRRGAATPAEPAPVMTLDERRARVAALSATAADAFKRTKPQHNG